MRCLWQALPERHGIRLISDSLDNGCSQAPGLWTAGSPESPHLDPLGVKRALSAFLVGAAKLLFGNASEIQLPVLGMCVQLALCWAEVSCEDT